MDKLICMTSEEEDYYENTIERFTLILYRLGIISSIQYDKIAYRLYYKFTMRGWIRQ